MPPSIQNPEPKTVMNPAWYYVGVGLVALLGAGAMYRLATAPRKGKKASKRDEDLAMALDATSANATRVIAALAPVAAFPAAYIGVQMMEDHGMITKGLGNAAQTLMTGQVAGGLLGTIAKLVV
jgi:type II secretory pathway pseudopilin PulG